MTGLIQNYVLPVATSSVLGGVKPDGTTITNSTGAVSVTYGTGANTAAQGNDSRITGAAQQTAHVSWTPSDASGATLTFTSVSCQWTQIGNIVYAYGTLTYPSTVNASQAVIGGLPVSVPNQTYAATPHYIRTNAAGLTANTLAFPIVNTATFNIFLTGNASGILNSTLSGATLWFMLIYPAA